MLRYLVFIIVLFHATSLSAQCIREADSLQLVKIYNQWDGDNWNLVGGSNKPNSGTSWSDSIPMSLWHGVRLNENGCVQSLNLDINIPDSMLSLIHI